MRPPSIFSVSRQASGRNTSDEVTTEGIESLRPLSRRYRDRVSSARGIGAQQLRAKRLQRVGHVFDAHVGDGVGAHGEHASAIDDFALRIRRQLEVARIVTAQHDRAHRAHIRTRRLQ